MELHRRGEGIPIDDHGLGFDARFTLVYDELKRLAAVCLEGERRVTTLQPTALLHEAYLRLARLEKLEWNDALHFFGAASRTMRRVLVDHARRRAAQRRGGGARRISLTDSIATTSSPEVDVLALDEALSTLATLNERHARVVELRFFAGLGVDEVAELLGVSASTVAIEWRIARAWLGRRLVAGEAGS